MDKITGRSSTTITTHLLIINCIMLAGSTILEKKGIDLNNILGLHYYASDQFHWWQCVTYMFMHGNFMHLFSNMFSLYMFGRLLEMVWGENRFAIYYLFTGIGAAIIQQLAWRYEMVNHVAQYAVHPEFAEQIRSMTYSEIINLEGVPELLNHLVTVGASGSVFGILLAFGMMFPDAEILLLFPPIPMKAKWLVIIYGAFELFAGVGNYQPGIAHYAHLGGMLFGFLLIMFWKKHRNYDF